MENTSTVKFTQEVTRFTFHLKQEVLTDILSKLVHDEDKSILETSLSTLKDELETFEKKQKSLEKKRGGPKEKVVRPLSAYNRFIKTELPNISKKYPELEQTKHMSKAAELWRALTIEEKEAYKTLDCSKETDKKDTDKKEKCEPTDSTPEQPVVKKVVKKKAVRNDA